VLAGRIYGIPIFGTMAHSYIQAHDSEASSFEAFARLYPETTLLVDTYDTLEGVRKVIDLSRKLGDRFRVRAVRLDSGDLGALASDARKLLDEAGLKEVTIFASSNLDEYEIQRLVNSGAPIEAFGVGTKLAVMDDASHLDMAYKLVEYAGQGRLKLSARKVLHPGRKQIFRQVENGRMVRDVIGRYDEQLPGEPLLQPMMRGGVSIVQIDLEESRRHFQNELARLPDRLRELGSSPALYTPAFSERLQHDLERIQRVLARP
jgi:nicotinate phosphoribosyltransferase